MGSPAGFIRNRHARRGHGSRSAAPGGWVILSHSKFGGAPVKDAVTTLHAAIIAACHQTRRTLVPAH